MNQWELSKAIANKLVGSNEKFDATNSVGPSAAAIFGLGSLMATIVAVFLFVIFVIPRVLVNRFLWNHCAVPGLGVPPIGSFWVAAGLTWLFVKVV